MSKEQEQQVVPPPSFVHDIRYAVASVSELARMAGVSDKTAKKLMNGQPVYRGQLEQALHAFYGDMTGAGLAVQFQAMPPRSRTIRKVLALLRAAADFVAAFRGSLRLSRTLRGYWVFQPRLTLRHLVEVLEECDDLLYRVHHECPKYDKSVFRNQPELLQEYKEKELIYGGRNVYHRHVARRGDAQPEAATPPSGSES